VAKLSTKIAREWSKERVQWGRPVGQHDAVAQKIAFIAATSFGLEAMLDVSSRLADDKKNDVRIEAALAKLYASELGWKVTDELMQVRGGRGYETAESLQARGEKPVPVEQMMRDMRINRIFEGSTEIMHLLIAREAVDQHLEVAGEILEGDGDLKEKAKIGVQAALVDREPVGLRGDDLSTEQRHDDLEALLHHPPLLVDLDAEQVERLGPGAAVRVRAQLCLRVVLVGEALADLAVEVTGEQDGLGQLEGKRQVGGMHDGFLLMDGRGTD